MVSRAPIFPVENLVEPCGSTFINSALAILGIVRERAVMVQGSGNWSTHRSSNSERQITRYLILYLGSLPAHEHATQ